MSSNVGLATPRGTGTSGYVQRNAATLKPRSTGFGQPYNLDARPPKIRKPDADILRHDRLRDIEVKVAELQDKLEEEGKLDKDEIEAACDKERERLTADLDKNRKSGRDRKNKTYQVHEMAEAKAVESDKLRRALGLKGSSKDVDEEEHPMARQERRKREDGERRERESDGRDGRRRNDD